MIPRRALFLVPMVVMLFGLVAYSPAAGAAAPAGNLPPFKIGVAGPLSGSFASSAKDVIDGLKLYLEGINYTANGRKIQLIIEDDAGNPTTDLAKLRKMIEQDKVEVLVGPLLGPGQLAVVPYLNQVKMPALYPTAFPDDIVHKPSPWIISTAYPQSAPQQAFGKWVYDQGKRRVAIIGYDYSFGWGNVGGFQKVFEDSGGKVVQKIWTPMVTPDFAPYLSQLKKDVDAVVVAQSGSNGNRFLQQWQQFGLKGTVPLYGLAAITDEALLKSMGDEAVGLVTALIWSTALQTPAAQAFVKKFEDTYKVPPGYRAEAGYVSGKVIVKALDATGGNPGGSQRLMDAIRSVRITDAPRGPIHYDQYGGIVENVYIRKVERVNGKLQNTIIDTIPNVSQFWTYDPQKYLSEPVYSHDYPPCPNCE